MLLREPRGIDAQLEGEGLGTTFVDVAFGGMRYGPRSALCSSRTKRAAAREQLPCVRPGDPEIAGVSIVQIAEPWLG